MPKVAQRPVLPSKAESLGASPKSKVIGIVGSRRRDGVEDMDACIRAFDALYKPGDTLVSGGCSRGGDAYAEYIAKTRGLTITIHYADWQGWAAGNTAFNRATGFARNTKIARDCSVLIALCAPDRTGGTEDTVAKALRLGKTVVYA